jgi:putative MATE family efflux protein
MGKEGFFLRRFSVSQSLRPMIVWDKAFVKKLVTVALPIMFLNLVTSSLAIIDGVMVGHLGQAPYAAVTQMSRYIFLFNITQFGIVSGSSIFLAQFWGKKDLDGMRRVMGMCMRLTIPLALVFFSAARFLPHQVAGLFLQPGESAAYAAEFLTWVSPYFLVVSIEAAFIAAMKSSEQTFIPMLAGSIALATNTALNYILIFGKLGLPALGVRGSAIATVISGCVSIAINLTLSYKKRLASAISLKQLLAFDGAFFRKFLKTIVPVIFNEGLWALGITMYSIIFGRLGDTAVAAMGIYNTVDQLVFVTVYGLMHASAIIVGKSIGAGDPKEAYVYAKRLLFTAVSLGVATGIIMFFSRFWLTARFDISPEARQLAVTFMGFASLFSWAKAFNCINVVGVLRSGGDTVFSMMLDVGSIWCIGVPLTGIAALLLHFPPEAVLLCTWAEEVPKLVMGLRRMISKKWINNLTHIGQAET